MTSVCLLHPGAMGASLGRTLVGCGHDVRWVRADRSPATSARAAEAGLTAYDDLASALHDVEVVLSVCPPDRATDVARAVANAAFDGRYVDANAVAPATMREIATIVEAAGAEAVDGGIVGPPVRHHRTTRLFLSGSAAAGVAQLFIDTPLETVVIDGPIGHASATKVAYATWTKGSSALLLAVAAYAEAEGITDSLRAEWDRSQRGLDERLGLVAAGSVPKAWRFAGELADSGRAFADVGLPDGFGVAASDVYRCLESLRDQTGVTVDDALELLVPGRVEGGSWDLAEPSAAERTVRLGRRGFAAIARRVVRRRR